MNPLRPLAAAACSLAALAVAVPAASAQAPPANDQYLFPLVMHAPGTPIPQNDPRFDNPDTTNATTQTDLFAPPSAGGPPEPTSCGTSPIGKTVWYRAFPEISGILVANVAATFDPTIAIVPFNPQNNQPDIANGQCTDVGAGVTEELAVQVTPGAYAVQVGGFNGAGGQIPEVKLTFFPDRDGDGQLDALDRCPTRPGDVNGCPRRLDRQVRTPFRFQNRPGGVRLTSLKVDAPRSSRIALSCTRGACRRRTINAKPSTAPTVMKPFTGDAPASQPRAWKEQEAADPQAHAAVTRNILRFVNRNLRAGTRIVIRVTQRNAVGAYITLRVGNGSMSRTTQCTNPGSSRPRSRCR